MHQGPSSNRDPRDQGGQRREQTTPPWVRGQHPAEPTQDREDPNSFVLFDRTTLYMAQPLDAKAEGPIVQFINRAKELLSTTVVLYTPPIPNAAEQPITLAEYLEYQTRSLLTRSIMHPNHRHQTTLLDEIRISLGLGRSQELVQAVFRDLGATPEAQRLQEEVDQRTYKNVMSCAVHLLCAQLEANAAHRVLESLNVEMVGYLEAALRRELSGATANGGDPQTHPLFSAEGTKTFIRLVQQDAVNEFNSAMTSPASLRLLLENIGVHAGRLQGLYQSWVQSTGYPLGYPTGTYLLDDIHKQLERMPQDSFDWMTIATVAAMLRRLDSNRYGHLETYIDRTQPDIGLSLAEIPRKQQSFMQIVSKGVRQQRNPTLSRQAADAALLSSERKSLPRAFSDDGPEPSILKFALFSNGYRTPSLAALTATSFGLSLVTSIPELTPLTLGFGSITFASAFWNLPGQFSKIENKWITQLPRYGAVGTGLHFLYESIPQAAFFHLPSFAYNIIQHIPYNPMPRIAVFTLLALGTHQFIVNREDNETD